MKVSFIVPVYNVEKYLVECIESLLNQAVKDFEIILVDDGSTDNSGKICDEYQCKYENVQCIHQENAGVAVARNVGIKESRGEWIFFVDSDDAVSRYLIKECLVSLDSVDDVCFVGHQEMLENIVANDNFITQKKKKIEKGDFEEFILATFNRDKKGKYDYHELKMATPCKFYKRKLLIDNKIEFPEGICTGEDALFNLKVYEMACSGCYIPDKLYYHRVWSGSVSQKYDKDAVKHFEDLHRELLKYISKVGKTQALMDAYNERCIWSIGFCCILDFCSSKNNETYSKRKKRFREMRKKYETQITKVDLSQFRLQKKILFYFIKKNNFELISLLCYLQRKINVN